jgi:hypothetical protein
VTVRPDDTFACHFQHLVQERRHRLLDVLVHPRVVQVSPERRSQP